MSAPPGTPNDKPHAPPIPPRTAMIIAAILLALVVVLTFAIDERDDFEAGVIWVLLALAAAAAASAIPGAMNLGLSPLKSLAVTASGPVVIFFVVLVVEPGILDDDPEPTPTPTSAPAAIASPVASPAASPAASPVASPGASPAAAPSPFTMAGR